MSSGEQPLPLMIQGPTLETRFPESAQRQVKSVGAQLMAVAACARQPSAQRGRDATRLGRFVGELVADEDVVVEVWADVRVRKTETRNNPGCIFGLGNCAV